MDEMAEEVGGVPLHAVMLPGTHNSGAYNKFQSYSDDTVVMRYTVNQGEDVWTQLMFGIRLYSEKGKNILVGINYPQVMK